MSGHFFIFSLLFFTTIYFITEGKRNYVLQLTAMDGTLDKGGWVESKKIKVSKYNRTMSVLKGVLSLKKDLPLTVRCSVQAYQNLGGGKYGKGPVSIPETSCCEFIEKDDIIIPSVKKATNLPHKCPINKMDISINSYNLNHGNFPDTLPPPNDWMVELNISSPSPAEIIWQIRFFVTIVRDGPVGALG